MNASPNAGLRHDYGRIVRSRLGLVILISLLAMTAAGVMTFLTPKQYVSFATIQVEPAAAAANSVDGATAQPLDDSKLTESQFQIITGHGVLDAVVQHLDLQNKWAENGVQLPLESAYNKLLSRLQIQAVHPHLIRISAYSTDPEEPGLLANAVALEYVDQRNSQQQTAIAKQLEQAQNEVQQRETSASSAFAKAARLRTEAGFVDPNPDSPDLTKRPQEPATSDQEKLNEAESNIATLKSRVDELSRLKSADLTRATDLLNLNDPVLEQKLPLYQNALAEKARLLSSGLGHNHPDVRAIQTQIDTIEGQLRQQLDGIRNGLIAQLTNAEETLKNLQKSLEANRSAQPTGPDAPYLEAKSQYDEERNLLEAAKAKLNTVAAESATLQKSAAVRDAAQAAFAINSPKLLLNLSAGAITGLLLGMGFALLFELLDRSVKTLRQVERLLRVPVLAVIPKNLHLLPHPNPEDLDTEPYRILTTNVDSARQKVGASVLTVVSGGPGEGKSTTVGSLATAYAGTGQQTLIVDANLRRPSQHELFDLDNRVGLSDYLRGKTAFEEIIQDTQIPNLFIITSGSSPASAVTLLSSQKFAQLVEIVKDWFDLVIFDCPSILGTSDASVISALADGSIMVAQHRRFPRASMVRAKTALQNAGTKILGVVLNNAYVKYSRKNPLPTTAVRERPEKAFGLSDLEAAANRSPRNEAY